MKYVKVYTSRIDTPLGIMIAGVTSKGLCLLEFDDEKRLDRHFSKFAKDWEYELVEEENELILTVKNQLNEYFSGNRHTFDLPFDLVGTKFQIKVWNELLTIPFGVTRSYKEQAIAVGNLKAIRAVATANGENRISIIIPCHRVIGSDGSLTGYGGEVWRKQKLLDLESTQTKLF